MFLSVFDICGIGVGASWSHTVGPILAARPSIDLVSTVEPHDPEALGCHLYRSLAHTSEGDGTVRPVLCGQMGRRPESYDQEMAEKALSLLEQSAALRLPNGRALALISPALRRPCLRAFLCRGICGRRGCCSKGIGVKPAVQRAALPVCRRCFSARPY